MLGLLLAKGLPLQDKRFENHLAQTTNFAREETKDQVWLLPPKQARDFLLSDFFFFSFYKENKTSWVILKAYFMHCHP